MAQQFYDSNDSPEAKKRLEYYHNEIMGQLAYETSIEAITGNISVYALAYVLEKENAGIVVMKMNENGKFIEKHARDGFLQIELETCKND